MVRVENKNGETTTANTVRLSHCRDGSVLEEHLRAFEPPRTMRYQIVGGLRPPISWLVRTAAGNWTFQPENERTTVCWQFRFTLTTPFAYPMARSAAFQFQRAKRLCLDKLQTALRDGTADC